MSFRENTLGNRAQRRRARRGGAQQRITSSLILVSREKWSLRFHSLMNPCTRRVHFVDEPTVRIFASTPSTSALDAMTFLATMATDGPIFILAHSPPCMYTLTSLHSVYLTNCLDLFLARFILSHDVRFLPGVHFNQFHDSCGVASAAWPLSSIESCSSQDFIDQLTGICRPSIVRPPSDEFKDRSILPLAPCWDLIAPGPPRQGYNSILYSHLTSGACDAAPETRLIFNSLMSLLKIITLDPSVMDARSLSYFTQMIEIHLLYITPCLTEAHCMVGSLPPSKCAVCFCLLFKFAEMPKARS